jgi:hypothetical protein
LPHPSRRPDDDLSARHGLWSTVQAAVAGGWGSTFRLVLILVILATTIIALRLGDAAPILAFFK